VPEDFNPCLAVSEAVSSIEGKRIEFIENTLELDESIDIIQNANLVISNRLHVLLPALMSGVSHVSLTDLRSHRKLVALYETIGANFVLHDINSVEPLNISPENESNTLLSLANVQINIAEQELTKAFK
jgi:polysaccharide pyruvyl transferase WcaK-like protein